MGKLPEGENLQTNRLKSDQSWKELEKRIALCFLVQKDKFPLLLKLQSSLVKLFNSWDITIFL